MSKISIIVPVYNAERYLEKCLKSIQDQTIQDIEVFVVNDGSIDNSAQICEQFCKKDNRFHYINQQNSGVSSARNKGLELATGDYIGFVDSDDWVESDMYELLYKLVQSKDADVAIQSFFFDNGKGLDRVSDNLDVHMFSSEESISELLNGKRFNGELCNKLFKREFFDTIKLDESIHTSEDLVAVCEIFCKSDKIVFQDVHKYHYVYNSESACHRPFNEKKWSLQKACRAIVNILSSYCPQMVAYAQKHLINGNLTLASELCKYKKLTKCNYKKIKEEITPFVNKESTNLLERKTRISLRVFQLSRILYKIMRVFINGFRKQKKDNQSW